MRLPQFRLRMYLIGVALMALVLGAVREGQDHAARHRHGAGYLIAERLFADGEARKSSAPRLGDDLGLVLGIAVAGLAIATLRRRFASGV